MSEGDRVSVVIYGNTTKGVILKFESKNCLVRLLDGSLVIVPTDSLKPENR